MPKALYNGEVIAQASDDDVVIVEGNVYFPPEAVDAKAIVRSATHTICPWKGTASYYDVIAGGKVEKDAAWFYPDPKPEARHVAGRVAFWKGVKVER